ncbi:MAG: acyl carrier protein [Myxococcota bacterium]
MTKDDFISELANVLQVEADVLKPETELAQFEGWDSTAVINLIVLYEELGAEVEESQVPECKTVQDVLNLTGGNLE